MAGSRVITPAPIPGQSIVREVDADNEWCAEAYLETDYAALNQDDFKRFVQSYFVYKLVGISMTEKAEEDEEVEAV
jgi:hypothetical protein